MRKLCILLAIVLVIMAPAAAAGWPPEPLIEMRVPVAPTEEGLPYRLDEYEAVVNGVAERRKGELPTRGTIVNFVR